MSISFFSKFGWWNVPTWRSQVPAELSAVNCLLRIIFKYKVDLPFSDKLLEESSNSSLSSEWAPPYVWQVATWVLQTTWVLSPSRRIPYVSSQEIMNSLYRQWILFNVTVFIEYWDRESKWLLHGLLLASLFCLFSQTGVPRGGLLNNSDFSALTFGEHILSPSLDQGRLGSCSFRLQIITRQFLCLLFW